MFNMNVMNQNDTQYYDPDERFGQKLDFNTILMRQIDKVRTAGSVEWIGGYWERKTFAMAGMSGMATNVYIPDTRKVYINSVKVLYDLLLPYFDEEFNQVFDDLNNQENEKEKRLRETLDKNIEKAKAGGMNQKDEFDNYKNQYSKRVLEYEMETYRKTFHALLLLINRKGLIDNPGVREIA